MTNTPDTRAIPTTLDEITAFAREVAEAAGLEDKLTLMDRMMRRLEQYMVGLILLSAGSESNTLEEIRQGHDWAQQVFTQLEAMADELVAEATGKLVQE